MLSAPMRHYGSKSLSYSGKALQPWQGLCLVTGFLMTAGGSLYAQGTYMMSPDKPIESNSAARTESLARYTNAQDVTLELHDSTILYTLHALAQQAKLGLTYNKKLLELSRRTTVRIVKANVMDAFAQVLKGTTLFATKTLDGGTIAIRSRTDSAAKTQDTRIVGSITGKVLDSLGKGLSGVTVGIRGTQITAVTNSAGTFILRQVPPGEYTLEAKLFGFRVVTQSVKVVDGKTEIVSFRLIALATQLSSVVTTAIGQEERLKIGSDIVKLDVAEIIKNAPVTTMSELLTGRVPGFVVQKTSGAPGAPSVIRSRGTNSLTLNNDPIIIVDGVRVAHSVSSQEDANNAVRGTNALENMKATLRGDAPSALDQIDPNTVESVEVLRGPSATALYGTDGANGAIIIKTKRGKAGKTQWTFSTIQGTKTIPGSYPVLHYLYGTDYEGLSTQCFPSYVENRCASYERVEKFQYLNDRRTTMLGRGSDQSYNVGISGGSAAVRYNFTAGTQKEIGIEKIPDNEVLRVERVTGDPIPERVRRPIGSDYDNGTAAINVAFNDKTDLAFTARIIRRVTRRNPLSSAISQYFRTPKLSDSAFISTKMIDYLRKTNASRIESPLSLKADWRPVEKITTMAAIGWQRTNFLNTELWSTDNNRVVGTNRGVYGRDESTLDVMSVDARAIFNMFSFWRISGPTTIAMNYVNSARNGAAVFADGLPLGGSSSYGAEKIIITERRNDKRVAGVLINQQICFNRNLYCTNFGTRADQGSGIGGNAGFPLFPRLDFSIPILSGESSWHGINLFRLRTAFGHSGIQPDISQKLRTFASSPTGFPGSIPGFTINTIGNAQLRPERSVEFEIGSDLSFWNDRVNLVVNQFFKRTKDLIVSVELPFSVNGGMSQAMNLGNVDNRGIEATLDMRVIDREFSNVSLRMSMAKNRNQLRSINPGYDASVNADRSTGATTRNVVGYPLNGWWARPLLSYEDLDGDRFISQREILVSDSAVYLGSGQPKYDANFETSVNLFRGQFNFTARLNYQNGMLRANQLRNSLENRIGLSIFNDTTSSLLEQAHTLAGTPYYRPISLLRFDALSFGYVVPSQLTQFLKVGQMRVALQGSNLRLWTTYSGKDPNVRSTQVGDEPEDFGVLPQPRTWMLRVTLNR